MWLLAIGLAVVLGAIGFSLAGYFGMFIGGIAGIVFALPGRTTWSFQGTPSGSGRSSGFGSDDDRKTEGPGWGGGASETGDSSSWGSDGGGGSTGGSSNND